MNVDYRMQFYHVNADQKWRTAVNIKIVMKAYVSK